MTTPIPQIKLRFKADPILNPALTTRLTDPDDAKELTTLTRLHLATHFTLMDRAIRSLNLTPDEVMTCLDAVQNWPITPDNAAYLAAEVENALRGDLADKWGIHGPTLMDKLNALPAFDRAALALTLRAAWETAPRHAGDLRAAARALNLLPPDRADVGRNL